MHNITYNEMVARYGKLAAIQLLQLIERVANTNDKIIPVDRNERLQNAFDAMNKN
ncbi:MAG: hypothetical protein WAO98_00185 [Alphaproteobacteria bacterium]